MSFRATYGNTNKKHIDRERERKKEEEAKSRGLREREEEEENERGKIDKETYILINKNT